MGRWLSAAPWGGVIAIAVIAAVSCGDTSGTSESASGATTTAASSTLAGGATATQATGASTTTRAAANATASGDCPRYLTVAQISDYMGRKMQSTLRAANQLGVVCEWLAVDDSAISASFRTYDGDDKTEFTSETQGAPKVSGYGDEAFQKSSALLGPSALFVRSGSLLFAVDAADINRRAGIDLQAVRGKMAQAVLATK